MILKDIQSLSNSTARHLETLWQVIHSTMFEIGIFNHEKLQSMFNTFKPNSWNVLRECQSKRTRKYLDGKSNSDSTTVTVRDTVGILSWLGNLNQTRTQNLNLLRIYS